MDRDLPKVWAPTGTDHASLNDCAKFIACHLQEGRDLTSFGFAPINSSFLNSTTSPFLLWTSTWESIHIAYVFPSASTPNAQYSLSAMGIDKDSLGLSLTHTGTNTVWFAYVAVHPQLVQPMALLITANVGNSNAVLEAKAVIINVYLAWRQQGQPFPMDTSAASSPAPLGFESALILASIHFF
ncbi:unnamed protein product [Rotaria sp. Silwood1]|nr:unnamed protein product [Rotaria sp. Silwood1]